MIWWSGFASGVAMITAVLHALFAIFYVPAWEGTWGDFGGELPAVTKLATSGPVCYGVPVAIAFAIVFISTRLRRDHRTLLILCVATAALAISAFAFVYWATMLPISELAGNISAE